MPSVYLLLAGLFTGITAFRVKAAFGLCFCMALSLLFLFLLVQLTKWRGHLFFFAVMVWAGFAVSVKAQLRSDQPVDAWAPRECASLEGIVKDLPSAKQNGKRSKIGFILDSERFLYPWTDCENTSAGLPLADSLRIQKVSGAVQVYLVNPSTIPEPGDRVRIFGAFQRPRNPLNPGEMDYAAYLAARHIYATFSGIGPASLRILEPDALLGWDARVQRIRGILAQRLDRTFGNDDLHAELLKALLLGLRSQFPQELWQMMMRTGTSHIISISGLHMSVLSAFVYILLLLLFHSQKKAAVGAAAALILYMFLAGGSIPVQRAALMGAAAYAGLMAEREIQPMRLLAWACLIQILQDPLSIESISFQLSFFSVFILLLLRYLPPVHWIIEPFRATALVLAGTLPLAAWHFHMISWTALIANLWAIPFFNFALVTGAGVLVLADVPGAGWLAAKVSALCLDAGFSGLRVLAQWRYGWAYVSQPSIFKIAHYYAWALSWFMVTAFCAKKNRSFLQVLFFAGWCASGSLLWIVGEGPAWSVTVLSGTRLPMVHIQSGRTHWLINAGQSSGGIETERRLLPYLKWRGIHQVEGLLLTDYPKDVDFALLRLQDEVILKKVYGPAPKGGRTPAFFLNKKQILWQRASHIPLVTSGSLRIQTLSRSGKIKLVQIMAENDAVLFLVTQFDTENIAAIERSRDRLAVIVLYGEAAGNQPGIRRHRDRLQKRMHHAVWVFAQEPLRHETVCNKASGMIQSYSLKKLGALQVFKGVKRQNLPQPGDEDQGLICLQFFLGHRVTVI